MSVPLRLVAFAVVLVVCAGAAYALGAAVGPVDPPGSGSATHGAPSTTVGHDGGHGS